jgi:putative SOS response-associated peptidase YedK
MCGRYYIEQEEDLAEMRQILTEVNRRYQGTEALSAMRTGEIAPSHVVPALRLSGETVVADLVQWGFLRFQGSGLVINARAETAAEKPMFRDALRQGRILVPANAFFEWRHDASGRAGQKMKLSLSREPTFYMAGLARFFTEPGQAAWQLDRFVILTTAANDSVRPVHDRMPVIVPRDQLRSYLQDEAAARLLLARPVGQQLQLTEAV